MPSLVQLRGPLRAFALAGALVLLAACGSKAVVVPNVAQAPNIPATFDVTLLADKDNQFDFDGAPLTPEDLRGAFRYRIEEHLPMSTVLLKRGEKQKIKKEHMSTLARIALEMKFKAFVLENDGAISQLVTELPAAD
jgi:hypothetical protein